MFPITASQNLKFILLSHTSLRNKDASKKQLSYKSVQNEFFAEMIIHFFLKIGK